MKTIGSYGPKRTVRIQGIAVVVAALISAMLLAQLFSYEDFAAILGGLMPYGDASLLKVTAAAIVIAELLALPYLLGMYLSPLMRLLSAVTAAGVSVFWLFTGFTNAHANNSGLFSTTLEIPGGIFATMLSLVLFAGMVLVIRSDTRIHSAPLEKNSKLG